MLIVSILRMSMLRRQTNFQSKKDKYLGLHIMKNDVGDGHRGKKLLIKKCRGKIDRVLTK